MGGVEYPTIAYCKETQSINIKDNLITFRIYREINEDFLSFTVKKGTTWKDFIDEGNLNYLFLSCYNSNTKYNEYGIYVMCQDAFAHIGTGNYSTYYLYKYCDMYDTECLQNQYLYSPLPTDEILPMDYMFL